MTLKKKFGELKNTLLNVNNEIASRVLNILEASGSAIIKAEDLESQGYNVSLDKMLILSNHMKQAMQQFNDNIKTIGSVDSPRTGSLFYIAEYGGSKTQFIELINSIIKEQKERDLPPFNHVIPVTFNGSLDLTAAYLGEQIEQKTAKILSHVLDMLDREGKSNAETHSFENFMDLLVEFRKVKNAPEHLERIHSFLSDIETSGDLSTGLKLKISKIRNELAQLPLIDEERLLNIVFDIIEFASRYKIVYLFFFDECDDWLAKVEQESVWSQNFLIKQYFFRKLYDRIANLRLYQIYCFTPRIHELLRSEKSDSIPGIHRLSSDLTKYLSSSGPYSLIREQGIYQGEEAVEVVLKWLILLEKSFHSVDSTIFDSFLNKLISKIDNKLSRRKANATIISAIRAYMKLSEYIKNGQNHYDSAEKRPSYQLTIGDIIQDTFSSYLNFLNFNFEKKHHDVEGGKYVDGRFVSIKGRETGLYAEIKTFNKPDSFNLDKAKQVLNCVLNLNNKAVFFLFCNGLTDEFVKNKFYEWKLHGRISPEINLENIISIIINDQTLLNCLVGLKDIPYYQISKKFEDFDILVRLLDKDFHGKLMNLFPYPTEEVSPDNTYPTLLKTLKSFSNTIFRTAVEIVTILGTDKKVYTYRKEDVIKKHISPLLKNSFDDGIAFLKRNDIIGESTRGIHFNWDIYEEGDIKEDRIGLMIHILTNLLDKIRSSGE